MLAPRGNVVPKIVSPDLNSTWLPRFRTEKWRLSKAYIRFFPVFDATSRKILQPLRSLADYAPAGVFVGVEDLASVGSFLIDR